MGFVFIMLFLFDMPGFYFNPAALKPIHKTALVVFCFLFLFPVFTFSQKPEGIPFVRNYTPNEYDASSDSWAVAQDRRGIMYFGNASGILEYDGSKWRLIPVSNNSLVRSLSIADNGIIYVGAVGEFGYLAPNASGLMAYHSLLNRLPAGERDFADVWKTYVTPQGIYFQTFTKLIRINGNSLKIWKPETSFHFSFYINNELYINEREKGLKHIINDELTLVAGGDFFAGLRIYSMLPYPANRILAATREKGLVLIDLSGNSPSIKSMDAEANSFLINDQVYGGVALHNKHFAFATLKNGAIITDEAGRVLQVFNKGTGLQDDIVKFVSEDNQHDLWLALGNGISRIETSSPLAFVNDVQGLKGSVEDIAKIKGSIYIATSLGVFSTAGSTDKNKLQPIKGIGAQTWSLLPFYDDRDSFLLASSEAGIFKINGAACTLLADESGYILYQSMADPRRVYIGTGDGLSSIRCQNGKWVNEERIHGVDKEIRSIAEDANGDLWLGTPFDGIVKVSFNSTSNPSDSLVTAWQRHYTIRDYDTTSGLPEMQYNIPYCFLGRIVFATYNGVYEFDEKADRFIPSSFLKKELQQRQVYRFVPKGDSTVWLYTDGPKETGIASLQPDHSYSWYSKPFGKIRESEIHAIFPDNNGITWLGGPDGLLRYDAGIRKDFSQPFYTHIRTVSIGKDSLLFGGSFFITKDSMHVPVLSQPEQLIPTIGYSFHSLRFEYTATTFGDEQSNVFTIFLEGYDTDWSGWDHTSLKEYTNLKEGNYTFRVKAKNIYGTESIESSYSFTILPPWYRTIWAYIAYVIAFILFIYLMVQLSIRRLKAAKTQLEKTVKERTAEVVKQKEEIEHQKQIVESKNKDITDSINYAQRIQRSLLASNKLLDSYLDDYFIFFQPKDIVSGDFYWASPLSNGSFAFVTADSTGHGVPGAIMSMLNISCLNEAVNGKGLTAPHEILNYTRRKIIGHLSNDGSADGGKDGMDCSIVCFDKAKKEIRFAAANNPVWIVRNKEIIEFAPDKMPVGKHDNDTVSFSEHVFQLMSNDIVYTLTDGMPDQFGGPKGKKFMYRQLKELLVSISHLTMKEQENILRKALNDWKGEHEQVDDICLIGVRIRS
ncbi:MAG: Response regulator containing a CheY-like receiver domain and a domain protein [Bacteroidetes bacterium]|nr:Response regulator containing a CheY-like receiver domain and a domain protein [Bacteroidota bacterium]